MRGRTWLDLKVWGLVFLFLIPLMALPVGGADKQDGKPVRIGLVGTLFRDTPQPLVMALVQPFKSMMQTQTGLSGELVPGGDPLTVGRDLAEDKLQLAVFHGFEFGWARQKYPELKPLMIAVNQQQHLHAYLVVRSDADTVVFAELKGKTVAMPRGSREHCRVFLQKHCQECGFDPAQFFSRTTAPSNAEDALDDVVDGEVHATVADGVALDGFRRRKPGRYSRLKIVLTSEVFPAGVVAYHPGSLDEEAIRNFRTGMMNAPNTSMGRQLLTLWKLTGFEPVPPDYEETLQNIVKYYPAPTSGPK